MRSPMRVLVREQGGRRQIAAVAEGRLWEYVEETDGASSLVGAVYLGQVERVLPPVGAAFVKIGQPLNGFLPLAEMDSFQKSGQNQALVTGGEALVQVKKDPKDDKGAFLTRDIALAGLFCIYMPLNRHVGVSGRVTEEQDRERALALGKAVCQGEEGIIVRHAALWARPQEVAEEYDALRALWQGMQERAKHLKPPCILYKEPSALTALLRDHAARYDVTVFAEKPEVQAEIPAENIAFALQNQVELEALFQGAGVERQLREALGRRVSLEGGGTLVVDEREALTTIDVNSAKFVGASGMKSIALAQNLAACQEIARQIRLRNLGGIVLIDFIDMQTDAEREQVQETLAECLKSDRVKTAIHGFTSLGLLETTRKRTRESLSRLLTEPCPACRETGRKPLKP